VNTFGSDDDDEEDEEDAYLSMTAKTPAKSSAASTPATTSQPSDASLETSTTRSIFHHLNQANIDTTVSGETLTERLSIAKCLPVFCALISISAPENCHLLSAADLSHKR
jgi:hypothetical protein